MNGNQHRDGGDDEHDDDDNKDLHSLLSQTFHHSSWRPIYERIRSHPHEARERYYRHESPLQLALKAREQQRQQRRESGEGSTLDIERIQVLQALVDADPASIRSRDKEGRTCLHTACAAGRSGSVLKWLLRAEENEREERRLRRSHRRKHGDVGHKQRLEKINDDDDDEAAPLLPERNVTLRTDYPGGALPLHSVAACPTFDSASSVRRSPTVTSSPLQLHPYHPINRYLKNPFFTDVEVVSPNVIRAYSSTTIIRQAHPGAVWDRDCEGEIPLHAAASWGNVGSVLSLLMGAVAVSNSSGSNSCLEVARAALTADDRRKTPLDRACERVCSMCVHSKDSFLVQHSKTASLSSSPYHDNSRSLRRSVTREDDPFSASFNASTANNSLNDGRRSLLRRTGSGRRRIPGCGSSFRSSFSSSFGGGVGLGGSLLLDNLNDNHSSLEQTAGDSHPILRASFISPRIPIDPIRGLEPLDRDGEEEFVKVELLARAAYGFFDVGNESCKDDGLEDISIANETKPIASLVELDRFKLLHAVVALGCRAEIIWHAAARCPHQVEERDEFGRVPLYLACERLAMLHSRHVANRQVTVTEETAGETASDGTSNDEVQEDGTPEIAGSTEDSNSNDGIYRKFVESLLLGGDMSILQAGKANNVTQATRSQDPSQPPPLPVSPSLMEIEKKPSLDTVCDEDLMEHISITQETINILIHSPLFGEPEMASVPNCEGAEGRLALHTVLEAGMQWFEDGFHDFSGDKEELNNGHAQVVGRDNSKSMVQILVDAYPRALEIQDGKTRLFPFMIAATPKALLIDEEQEGICTMQLETVYQLLLKAPTMLCRHL